MDIEQLTEKAKHHYTNKSIRLNQDKGCYIIPPEVAMTVHIYRMVSAHLLTLQSIYALSDETLLELGLSLPAISEVEKKNITKFFKLAKEEDSSFLQSSVASKPKKNVQWKDPVKE